MLLERLTEIKLTNYTLNVKMRGDIDHHTAKSVREKIDEAILLNKPRFVILDLSNVDFMDSSGLGLVLGRYTKALDIGAKLIIHKPTRRIKRILEMAGIERIIEIKGDDYDEML
ncbi:MAG: anti-sigma factor antagonist [Clostridia bacterium]|nr:anti-sigma factor antagonist [Clostridia bacterium]